MAGAAATTHNHAAKELAKLTRVNVNLQGDGDAARAAFTQFVDALRPTIKAKQDKDDMGLM